MNKQSNISFLLMAYQPSTFILCQSLSCRRTVVVATNPKAEKIRRSYLFESERESITRIWTHLLWWHVSHNAMGIYARFNFGSSSTINANHSRVIIEAGPTGKNSGCFTAEHSLFKSCLIFGTNWRIKNHHKIERTEQKICSVLWSLLFSSFTLQIFFLCVLVALCTGTHDIPRSSCTKIKHQNSFLNQSCVKKRLYFIPREFFIPTLTVGLPLEFE